LGEDLRSLCVVVMLTLMAPAIAFAQGEGKNEIAGTFGHSFISDQSVPNSGLADSTISHGAGYSFEINYARILGGADWADIAIEVPAIFNPEDLHYFTNQIPEDYSSIFITPSARVRFFPDVDFSPWVSFGGGLGYFHASSDLLFFGKNTGNRGETTGILQGGVGLDVHIPGRIRRLKIRVEARDDWSGVPPINVNTGKTRQQNYYVAGGLAYRF